MKLWPALICASLVTFLWLLLSWRWLLGPPAPSPVDLTPIPKQPNDTWLWPRDVSIVHPHNYSFLMTSERLCGPATITLLVVVASSPDHDDRRQAIRDSWAGTDQQRRTRSRVAFLLGRPRDPGLQSRLVEENRVHGDIIQEDFEDTYQNLTLKTVMALRWSVIFCPRAQFLMKTDDDIFVNLPRLVEFLQNDGHSRWIVGCIKQKKAPRPISKTGMVPPLSGHPPFVAGAGYVLSADLAIPLFRASLQKKFIPVEDVFITAHCARLIGVSPEHHDGFSCGERVDQDCKMAIKFTGHQITPGRQHQLWLLLIDSWRGCACVQVCPWFVFPLVSLGLIVNFLLYVLVANKTTSEIPLIASSPPLNGSENNRSKTRNYEHQSNYNSSHTTLSKQTTKAIKFVDRKLDPHLYPYLINFEDVCPSDDYLLLLAAVCSAPDNFDQRSAIRRTWGNTSIEVFDVQVVFLLGRTMNSSTQDLIEKEAAQFSDIIQEDFIDSYYNLTLKSVMMLKWASTYCPSAKFVLKTDDDMFIHMPNLLNYLSAIADGAANVLFGHLQRRSKPNRSKSSKRYPLLESYHSEYFPSYLSGGAYVMSGDAAQALYSMATKTPLFLVEDVFITGICAKRARILRKDHGNFRFTKNLSHCAYKNGISGHGFRPEELDLVWEDVTKGNCTKRL